MIIEYGKGHLHVSSRWHLGEKTITILGNNYDNWEALLNTKFNIFELSMFFYLYKKGSWSEGFLNSVNLEYSRDSKQEIEIGGDLVWVEPPKIEDYMWRNPCVWMTIKEVVCSLSWRRWKGMIKIAWPSLSTLGMTGKLQ